MNKENARRNNKEIREQYCFDFERYALRMTNKKKSIRYTQTDRDERIAKYGMSNYLAYSEELVA